MRADMEQRLSRPVTIVHRVGDAWASSTYARCNVQLSERETVASDGTVSSQDVLKVQIPEDMGQVEVSEQDYLVVGEFSYSGDTRGLVQALPEGSRKVERISDRRGALGGIGGAVARYASVLILECA